ncbi:hypothetical protein ACFY4C_20875 [Actinomadura viridis]|uniref:hypothetical protein n=1 Tax=Actinomadura viridis TaxID=58110 RepID=UPI0036CA04F2
MARPEKTDFAVYETNKNAKYTMSYTCTCCGKPSQATGDDMKGLFVGRCENGTDATIFAS